MSGAMRGRGSSSYVELRPPNPLSEYVSTAWVRTTADGGPVLHRDIPDGTIDVHCRLSAPPVVLGPLTAPRVSWLEPGEVTVGLRLRPGAASALGLPAEDLVDQVVEARHVFAGSVGVVTDAARPDDALAGLAKIVLSRRRDRFAMDPMIGEAIRRMTSEQDISQVRALLNIPERSFRRRFRNAVGVGPQTLRRLLRFHKLLGEAQRAAAAGEPIAVGGLAALAAEFGYADQPHLTRECVRITGLPPRAFFGDLPRNCRDHDHRAAYG